MMASRGTDNRNGKLLAQQALDAVTLNGGNIAAAARALGEARSTIDSRFREAKALKLKTKVAPAPGQEAAREFSDMKDKCRELETQLKAVRTATLDDEYVKRKIIGIGEELEAVIAPAWCAKMAQGKAMPGVPTAFWSDWHWGEVVYPAQINGVNEFNLEIAHKRARSLVEKTIYLLRHHVVHADYPGIVLALGGDMMSGDIHEELTNTNDLPMMPCLLDLFGVLKWAIGELVEEFGNVFVPCVTGNHGRNTRKPRAKDRNFTNFDWLLYQFLSKAFEHDKRVQFMIPDGADALYTVFGHRYLLTHGDQFRGGDGIIGHFGPVLRGQKRKLSRNANIGLDFDTMIHGHFHTYFPTSQIIGNGSLKGMDEYAFQANFGYEAPIQALWLTHPEHGITIHMPVYLEKSAGQTSNAKKDWVSWHKQ